MTNPITIAVIDDEFALRNQLQASLEERGYRVLTAANGTLALEIIQTHKPAIIVLDLGLPDMDGSTIIRRVREWSRTPLIVLSVRNDEAQKVAALDAGADDYLTKPFNTHELMARIRVAERHLELQPQNNPILTCGELVMDLGQRSVRLADDEVHLTPTEYQLLRLLMLNQGRVLTHGALLRETWGPGYANDTQLLRGFIAQLRQKIELQPRHPQYILTEPGIGYRFASQPTQP